MSTTPTAMRFEVTTLPVADVERAKAFYLGIGWRLDIDFRPAPGIRGVQFTPPGSRASIHFGEGITAQPPGSAQGMILVVDDIEQAREQLVRGGADVGEVWHLEPGAGPMPGPDPERRSYLSRANFTDPDGNGWVLQEIRQRLPGREATLDVADRARLLHETALRHGAFEAAAPPHDWWDWYGAYMVAREDGAGPDDAAAAAARHMAEAKGVAVGV
jgi:hypothetical protein